jgi:LCP family protein required for cell wall assembly
MRTTLKRGIGRGAGQNGNGRAVLPPGIAGPMARYRQPPPPRRSTGALFVRVLGWLVVAIAVVVAGLAGGLYLYGHETLAALQPKSAAVKKTETILNPTPLPSQPAIGLIAGYDVRKGADASDFAGSRSDTVMLVRADPTQDTLSLLSFPRDLVVPIYCEGDTVYTHDRINAAWALCGGPAGTLDTVEHLTGLQINYLVTLDFHGFKVLVNKLHGVYMNVDRRYYIAPHTGTSAIDLHPGYQKLDGGQALQYVRFRHTDSDLYRLERQQLFLDALKSRLAQSLSVTEIPKLIGAVKGSVEIARGGGGALNLTEVQSYAGLAYHLPAGHLFRNSIPPDKLLNCGPQGAEICTDPSNVDAVVQDFVHPDVTLPTRAADQALGIKPKAKKTAKLKPSQISTLVLNAGNVAGRAANTDYLLRQQGYATVHLPPSIPANAPPPQTFETNVYYDPVQANAKQAARQLKVLFGAHTNVLPLSPAIAPYAQQAGNPLVVVAFGTSFDGTLATPPPPTEAPAKQAPSISDGVSVTESALQQVRSKAHVPLYVPHEVASGARLSRDEGVRPYKPLQNQHSVVLTFVQPNGLTYWQIEETTWKSAPILAHPTGHFDYKGHRFALYTTGGHVHMVVLRTPQASYWVVNSLLDELSNETMIAIAKSLQPIGK